MGSRLGGGYRKATFMKGKTCIVTGGNTGIGKATVEGLARLGATVVVACRDVAKGGAAIDEIRSRVAGADLKVMQLDLASLDSTRAFAAAFPKAHPRLDVLVENAGVSTGKRQVTADGFEMDFGVNHRFVQHEHDSLRLPGFAAVNVDAVQALACREFRVVHHLAVDSNPPRADPFCRLRA